MKGHWGPSLGTQTQWWQELSCYPVSAADSWWDFGNLPTSPSLGVTIWNVEKPASKVWESMTTTHGQAIKGNHYNFLDWGPWGQGQHWRILLGRPKHLAPAGIVEEERLNEEERKWSQWISTAGKVKLSQGETALSGGDLLSPMETPHQGWPPAGLRFPTQEDQEFVGWAHRGLPDSQTGAPPSDITAWDKKAQKYTQGSKDVWYRVTKTGHIMAITSIFRDLFT